MWAPLPTAQLIQRHLEMSGTTSYDQAVLGATDNCPAEGKTELQDERSLNRASQAEVCIQATWDPAGLGGA